MLSNERFGKVVFCLGDLNRARARGFNRVPFHGLLYNGIALYRSISKGIAPRGYRLPTSNELLELGEYLGRGVSYIEPAFVWFNFGKLKQAGTSTWSSPNSGADNLGNFNLLATGYRNHGVSSPFTQLGFQTLIPARPSSPYDEDLRSITIYYNKLEGYLGTGINGTFGPGFATGTPVRCIRNSPNGWNPGEVVFDYDRNLYTSIKVGNQIWLAQNLATTHFNDGDTIPEISDGAAFFNAGYMTSTPALCAFNNDWSNVFMPQ